MIQSIKEIAKKNKQMIGVGVSPTNREYISRTIQAAESAAAQNFADILLVGDKHQIESFGISSNLQVQHSLQPEYTLLELLLKNKIAGVVRGSLSSSKFLQEVKDQFKVSNLFRIALLETASNFCFFFAPIGIDEGQSLAEKVTLVHASLALLAFLKLGKAPIGILSGGRKSDMGRNKHVDKTITEAEELVSILKEQGTATVRHYEILIEDAIADHCRFILAPDGISGNLIYRTLVHLGAGKSHGAWYYNISHPIVDTSRVGPIFEYESAIALVSALASKNNLRA
ncbi:MAG TPA: methanogenesis marker protein Mmp4/MtxX [Candidatus Deferrimicrobium sp.]|nr:methanogenesis marker protein Mmp4/MtxX [Candidatus Deferrimicrobium sp.]